MSIGFQLTYTNDAGELQEWVVHADGLEAAQAAVEREIGPGFKLAGYRRIDHLEAGDLPPDGGARRLPE